MSWNGKIKGVTIIDRRAVLRMAVGLCVLALAAGCALYYAVAMPGDSYHGALPAPTATETDLAPRLEAHVTVLATDIGARNIENIRGLDAARDYIEAELRRYGYLDARLQRQTFTVLDRACSNIEATLPGHSRPEQIVVLGAHYDSVMDCPGANDNGSGTAATLELARLLAQARPAQTIRFVFFTNEEPPYFQTEEMGSLVYARACRERGDAITAMLSLETLGYYTDAPHSQVYPEPLHKFYPTEGNFIGFVASGSSRALAHRAVAAFRSQVHFPSEGVAAPGILPGIMWSDHWSFEQAGYPALMITDTAPYRYPHYHEMDDTPDKLDYPRFARVVAGLQPVLLALAGGEVAAAPAP